MTYICHILIKYVVKVNQMTTTNKNLVEKIFTGSIEELLNKGVVTIDKDHFIINQLFKDSFKQLIKNEVDDFYIDPEDSGSYQELEVGCFKFSFVIYFSTKTTYYPETGGVSYEHSNFECDEVSVTLEDEDGTCYELNSVQWDFLTKAFNQ